MTWTRLVASFFAVFAFATTSLAQDASQAPDQGPVVVGPEQGPVIGEPVPPPQYVPAPPPATEAAAPVDELSPNSIYVEGLGAGLLYSINYERLVIQELGVRVGLSYMSYGASVGTSSASVTSLTFPITASYLGIRSGKHILELGGGATIVYASGSSSGGGVSATGSGIGGMGVLMLGYRIHPLSGGGFQFRIGVMALLGPGVGLSPEAGTFGFLPWGYISLGGSF